MQKAPLALAATLTLIFTAPIAQAATLTNTTDPTAIGITVGSATNTMTATGFLQSGPFGGVSVAFSSPQFFNSGDAGVSGTFTNLMIMPDGLTFTDLTFNTAFNGSPSPTLVTVTGSDGESASAMIGNGTGPGTRTFSATSALIFAELTMARPSGGGVSGLGLSGLSEVPIPAALPLFATVLGGLGLLAWRRKRAAL